MLVEHVIGMPLLSLLLVYWWFGKHKEHFSVWPIIALSITLGFLYGGTMSLFYGLLGIWWWLTTQIIGTKVLRSIVVFGSACVVGFFLFLAQGRVEWEFALGSILISAIIWWGLYRASQGVLHVT